MIDFLMDYFRITVHTTTEECKELYDRYFKEALGNLVESPLGAKGYKGVYESAQGFQLKHNPGYDRDYCTFEFPGGACKAIPPDFFLPYYRYLVNNEIRFNVTRIDLAFDNVPFSPKQFRDAIDEDLANPELKIIRSLSQRESLSWRSKPYKEKEDGTGLGRDTCYFGSRSSDRYLRVYNMRGPTRIEIELKGERASLVAADLMSNQIDNWFEIMIGHLLDFIDIEKDWWKEFIGDSERAWGKMESPEVQDIQKLLNWYIDDLSASYAVLHEYTNGNIGKILLRYGRPKMEKNYANLLSLIHKPKYV